MNTDRPIDGLQQALENLDGARGEVVLDFSGRQRIDPGDIQAMEKLAAAADEKAVKIVLQGVNVAIYKVLKLAKLTTRFAFAA
jgi:anti-anti-sigma regulatory factor